MHNQIIRRILLVIVILSTVVVALPAQTIPSDASLWLDAGTGVTTDGGGNITGWTDQSSNARQLTPTGIAPTYVASAINGQPAISFVGTGNLSVNNVLGSTLFGANDVAVFVVLEPNSGFETAFSWVTNSSSRFLFHSPYSGSLLFQLWNDGPNDVVVADEPANYLGNWHLVDLSRTGTQAQITVDASTLPNTGITMTLPNAVSESATFIVGNDVFGNAFHGNIAEILIYPRTLSAGEDSAVNDYLGNKYGFAVVPEPGAYALIVAFAALVVGFGRSLRRSRNSLFRLN